MNNQVNILYWNCQGIGNKKQEVIQLAKQNKIHIILLNETQLSSRTVLKFPNFQIYRTDRMAVAGNRGTGGTAILISNRITHHLVNIQTTSIDNTRND